LNVIVVPGRGASRARGATSVGRSKLFEALRSGPVSVSAASTRDALPRYLAKIAKREGYDFDDLTEIAEQAGSNVRDSLMRLEVELLSGDKKGIPVRAKVSTENDHKHFCEKHSAAWHCALTH